MADADLIAIRMRLTGGRQVAEESKLAAKGIEETGAAAKAAGAEQAAANKRLATTAASLHKTGRFMTSYITAPLLGIGAASVYMSVNFKRQMGLVATDAGGTAKEVKVLEKSVLELAHTSQFGPTKLAEALFHVESSGYRGAKAMKVLNESQKLATAGNSDLQSTTYALVSATKALNSGDSLKGVTKVAAQLNEIVSHGDIRLEELTSAMSTGLLPTAKALGLSVADVGSALDVMTKRGIPAQRSAYALNFTLQKLVPSTEKAQEAFANLGIGEEQLLRVAQRKGLPTALALLGKKLAPMTKGGEVQTIDEMFGGGRMSKGLLVAIQHTGEMKELWHEVDGNVGLYRKHVREAENQPLIKLKVALASIEASLTEVGAVLVPIVVPAFEHLAHYVTTLLGGFAKLPTPLQHVVLELAAVAALSGPMLMFAGGVAKAILAIRKLAAVGGMSGGLGKVGMAGAGVGASLMAGQAIGGKGGEAVSLVGSGASIGMMFGPWGAAIGAAIGLLITFRKQVKEGFEWLVSFTKKHSLLVAGALSLIFGPLPILVALGIKFHTQIEAALGGAFKWTVNAANNVADFFSALPGRIFDGIKALPGLLWSVLKKAPELLGKFIGFWIALPFRIGYIIVKLQITVVSKLAHLASKMPALGVRIVTFIVHGLISAVPAVISFFVHLQIKIATFWVNMQIKAVTWGAHMLASIVKGLIAAAPGIWGWFKALPGRIWGFISKAAPKLFEAGKHIATQIAHGLKSGLEDLLPGPVKEALGAVGGAAGAVGSFLGVNAMGTTDWRGGLSIVGEQGPEIVNLPRHSEVLPAGPSRRLLDGGGGPKTALLAKQMRGGNGGSRLLVPVVVKVGRREVASVVAEAREDDEARL